MKKTYRGWIALKDDGEASDILHIGGTKESWLSKGSDEPLAKQVEEAMWSHGKMLTVRYWLSDKEESFEDMQKGFLNHVMGLAKADYGHRYSEITGYLWTDEELNVGGHNLIDEIGSNVGKFIHLEIEYATKGSK